MTITTSLATCSLILHAALDGARRHSGHPLEGARERGAAPQTAAEAGIWTPIDARSPEHEAPVPAQ